ncbi:MAG: MFS transporter, partial [Nitrososphaerales archaeon]|nr:MFS transporter [Nitrososphaerales archaeon]
MSLRENKLRILISCITVFIVMLGVGIISPILPIYAESFNVPYFIAGFVISAFGLARLVSDVPMGSFADRFGRKRMMLMGTIFFTISASIAAYSTDIYQLIFSRLIQGIGAAMLTTSAMAYIGDIAPVNERGLYMSFFQGSFFLGVAAGPAVGGFIVELGGLRAPFITLSILAFIATIFTQFTVHECIQVDREERKFHVHFNEIMNMLRDKNLLVLYGGSIVSFTMVGGLRNV